jgi:hypothetical protein
MVQVEPFWVLLGYTFVTYITLVIVSSQFAFRCA